MQIAQANRRDMPMPVDSAPATRSFPSSSFHFRAGTSENLGPSSSFYTTSSQPTSNQGDTSRLGNLGHSVVQPALSSTQLQSATSHRHLDLRNPPPRVKSTARQPTLSENSSSISDHQTSFASALPAHVDSNIDPRLLYSASQPVSQRITSQDSSRSQSMVQNRSMEAFGNNTEQRGQDQIGNNADMRQELPEGHDGYGEDHDHNGYSASNKNGYEDMYEDEDQDQNNDENENENEDGYGYEQEGDSDNEDRDEDGDNEDGNHGTGTQGHCMPAENDIGMLHHGVVASAILIPLSCLH